MFSSCSCWSRNPVGGFGTICRERGSSRTRANEESSPPSPGGNRAPSKLKSPEVVLNLFVSASSSLYTLADLLFAIPLRGAGRDHYLGSGLTANRKNCSTPRDSILPLTDIPVRLDQRLAIDPYWPSLTHLAMLQSDLARAPDAAPTG